MAARARFAVWALSLWAAACATSRPTPAPVGVTSPTHAPRPAPKSALYPVDEALADVLSGELHYVDTGRWPGVERSYACAFRNQRVWVVNAYCTLQEAPAFRIDVYSPTRGRVSIYAEAKRPFSTKQRASYFTFTASSSPPAGPEARISPVALTMSYQELRQHERQRYDAFLPTCFGGQRHEQKEGACLGALAPHARAWSDRNRSFIDRANQDWYRVVRLMRTLATRHGKDPD